MSAGADQSADKVVAKPKEIGMPTKKTIVVPCMVNMRLKTWGETK